MSMERAIKNFATQFTYVPVIENKNRLVKNRPVVVAGMGGSGLAAQFVQLFHPERIVAVHEDYGLPESFPKNALVIAYSYSGNTEETIDAFQLAGKKKYARAVVATGGKLLAFAKKEHVPYIQLPATGIQPRMALGLSTKALLNLCGAQKTLTEFSKLATQLHPSYFIAKGKSLARTLGGKVPILYTSTRYTTVARTWKIKFNETGKIPSFFNVLPELNHNEMTGFDVQPSSKKLSNNFHFLFLRDANDHPGILRRMQVLERLYRARGLPVTVVPIAGPSLAYKIFSSLVLGDWTAYYTAQHYGLESEQVPMVEEFKKMIN